MNNTFSEEQLLPTEKDAIDRYLAATMIPFVQEHGERAAVLGTATLFRVHQRVFLVTAAHSFEDFDPEQVGVPVLTADGRRAFLTLNDCRRYYFDEKEFAIDVSIIEVLSDKLRADLERTSYSFLGPEDVAPHAAAFDRYMIAGYPRDSALVTAGNISPRAIKITTDLYRGPLPDKFDAQRDILLTFEKQEAGPPLGTPENPKLFGVSGAAVWGFRHTVPPEGLWHPYHSVKLVAVQVSTNHSTYIRGKRWWLVGRMFDKIDPILGSEFMERLGARP